jgi:hypothetical protein
MASLMPSTCLDGEGGPGGGGDGGGDVRPGRLACEVFPAHLDGELGPGEGGGDGDGDRG